MEDSSYICWENQYVQDHLSDQEALNIKQKNLQILSEFYFLATIAGKENQIFLEHTPTVDSPV